MPFICRWWVLGVALSAGAGCALAQSASKAKPDAVLLRHALPEGETCRYHIVSTTSPLDPGSAEAPTRSEHRIEETIRNVRPDGVFTVHLTAPGTAARWTATYDVRGRIKDLLINDKPAPPFDRLNAMLGRPFLPDRPVTVGDTWTLEEDNPAAKGQKVRIEYRLEDIEKTPKATLYRIHAKAAIEVPLKVTADNLYIIDADGRVMKATNTLVGLPSLQGPTKNVSVLERLPSTGEDKPGKS